MELITVLGNVMRYCAVAARSAQSAAAQGRGLTPEQLASLARTKRSCVAHLMSRMCDEDAYVRCAARDVAGMTCKAWMLWQT